MPAIVLLGAQWGDEGKIKTKALRTGKMGVVLP
jgi:adenylosuccinate synthase